MTPETWGEEELRAIAAAMLAFERRCEAIVLLIGQKRTLSPYERANVEVQYRTLKNDLVEAAKTGTLSGKRGGMTRAEIVFYSKAVRDAKNALKPATNSNPIKSRWSGAASEARRELSYYRDHLESQLQQS